MNKTITTGNLDVGYDKRTVVKNVNIDGLKGQIICLLGPNGVGKSTILRTLSGLLSPVSGIVEIEGTDLSQIKRGDIAKKLSVVLTDSVSPRLITVKELITMGRSPYTNFFGKISDEDRGIIDDAIESVGVGYLKDRFFSQLSDGEKQKVMIARALAQEPKLIILDEPTSHLDIRHKVEVIRVLRKLAQERNITVILSLHDIDLAIKGCQRVLLVKDGEILDQGTPEDIIKKGCIDRLYDVSGAVYNELLGSVEIEGSKGDDGIFVIGGGGSGINPYRAISREGFAVSAGILHENDVDLQVAGAICNEVITEGAFNPISEENYQRACKIIEKSKIIVDTRFTIGIINKKNADLLRFALEKGRIILSLREKKELNSLLKISDNENVIYCESISQLTAEIKKHI